MPHATYTHGHHESVLRSHRWRTAENSAGYLLPHLRPGMSLLDVGCGAGTITAGLAARLSPGRVVGIDPSAEVVAQARAVAGQGPGAARVEVGDVETWDGGGARFDVVHAHQVLQHVPDPPAVLRAMAGRCVPGGLVAARDGDYSAFDWYPRLPELDRWLELYRTVHRANGGEPDAGPRLLSWAHEAGLDDVTVSASVWCFATEADRAWWGGTWAARTVQSLGPQLVARGLSTPAELQDIAAAWNRWAAHPDAVFVVPNGEILCRLPG